MSNSFGIPKEVEERIRRRDKKCVYCHKTMIYPWVKDNPGDSATIEHFRENGPVYWEDGLREEDLAICCGDCNSNRGEKSLKKWFTSNHCLKKNINENTVAEPIKKYIKKLE